MYKNNMLMLALILTAACCPCNAEVITLTYNQAVGGLEGLPADAVVVWTATFDLSTHPVNPFVLVSQPAGRVYVGPAQSPSISWSGDAISSILPNTPIYFMGIKFYVFYSAIPPGDTYESPCNQPCSPGRPSVLATYASYNNYSWTTSHPNTLATNQSSLSAVSTTPNPVPLPGTLTLVIIGGLTLVLKHYFPRLKDVMSLSIR